MLTGAMNAAETAFVRESAAFVDAAPGILADYIRVDTTNPPGNESRGVEFLAAILAAANIDYEVAESAPGRGNLWARLPATTARKLPGLLLLHHIDVVPANAEYWSVDPFAGLIRDGYIWGRGAADTKGLGVAQLQAFLALAAADLPRQRDVVFMATADEEAGGFHGAGWMVQNRREVFEEIGFLLNEGGGGRLFDGDTVFLIEVTQKVPVWLRIKATGRAGHGSVPRMETAVTRVVRAGHRIATTRFAPRVIEPVEAMFAGIAPYQPEHLRDEYAKIRAAVADPEFLTALQVAKPGDHALLRDTCSVTTLVGSDKINVVPPEAVIELDCRLVPDGDVDEFISLIETVINDTEVSVEKIMSFSPAITTDDTELFDAMATVTADRYPGSRMLPGVSSGFTDSHFFRDIGIAAYGFAPFVSDPDVPLGVHGNDERLSHRNLTQGTRTLIDLLERFVTVR